MNDFLLGAGTALFITAVFSALFYCLRRRRRKRLDREQEDIVRQHFAETREMYRQMRGWRHDYRNHMQVMKAMLSLGKAKELAAYLQELDRELTEVDTAVKTGNITVDAVLNSKLTAAEKNGISVIAKAMVPEALAVPETDLCVIIGNLLDNAVEANMKLPEKHRFLRVYIGELRGRLYISVTNATKGRAGGQGGLFRTTKPGADHGFGLLRIDKAVRRSGGSVNRQSEDGVFATEVLMPLENTVRA